MIRTRATAIYLLRDWRNSKGAQREFLAVMQINTGNRRILIYYEEANDRIQMEVDIRDQVLTCLIPENSNE